MSARTLRPDVADLVRIGVYAAFVLALSTIFLVTSASNGFRLSEETKSRVALTPATTVSQFQRHFIGGLFHDNVVHIGFNLTVFTIGYVLATQRAAPVLTAATSYSIGILAVFLTHIFIVIPLARMGLAYAQNALDHPLVGFSVIAYATLGAGLHVLPKAAQWWVAGGIIVFEAGAALFVTAPFVSVYHLTGFGLGFYIRSLLSAST